MINCMIAGVGGQGTVLMARLIGTAAIGAGLDVRGTETIGMAQRGGSVVSHVRMGKDAHSPLIPLGGADVIIAFEPGEAVRAFPFLAGDGAMIVCDRAVRPVTSSLGKDGYTGEAMLCFLREHVKSLIVVDGDALIASCGSAKVVNVALLGVAVGRGLLPFTAEDAERTIVEKVSERFVEMNRKAFGIGIMLAGKEG